MFLLPVTNKKWKYNTYCRSRAYSRANFRTKKLNLINSQFMNGHRSQIVCVTDRCSKYLRQIIPYVDSQRFFSMNDASDNLKRTTTVLITTKPLRSFLLGPEWFYDSQLLYLATRIRSRTCVYVPRHHKNHVCFPCILEPNSLSLRIIVTSCIKSWRNLFLRSCLLAYWMSA